MGRRGDRKTARGGDSGRDLVPTTDGGRFAYARRSVVRRLVDGAPETPGAAPASGPVYSAAADVDAVSEAAGAASPLLAPPAGAAMLDATSASSHAGADIQFEGAAIIEGCNADAASTLTFTSVSPCVDAASAPVRRRLVGKQSAHGHGLPGDRGPVNVGASTPAVADQRPTQPPATSCSAAVGLSPDGAA